MVDAFIWRRRTSTTSSWSTQKIHVALGADVSDRVPVNERGISYLSFDEDGRVASMSPDLA